MSQKINHYRFIFAAIILSIIALSLSPAYCADKVYKLRMQTSDPAAAIASSYLKEEFIDRIKAMSNGRIDITLYSAGQLVPSLEVANALSAGMVDMSYIAGAYFAGKIPEAGLEYNALPPALLQNQDDLMEVYWERGLDEVIREGYAKKGVYYLGTFLQGDANTHWSSKPIKSVEDLKGYKIRAYGYANKVFQKLGASPVFIPLEEAYSALAQGVIDGYYTGGKHYLTSKMYEVAPYYHLPGWNPLVSMNILVSMKVWKKLPADLQAIMEAALKSFAVTHCHRRYELHRKMVNDFDNMKVTPVIWPQSEMDKVREAAISFLPEIAAKSELNAKGVKILTDYMKEMNYMK